MRKLTIADYKLIDKVTAIDVIAVTSKCVTIDDYRIMHKKIKKIINSKEEPYMHIKPIDYCNYLTRKYKD
jgi:hypothetical protein